MSGVYNRKLFRQSGARDELRKMGGIMSSSEELMREALMTGMQAPGPADLGPMPMPQQPVIGMPAPPVMQPQQPMVQPQPPMDMGMQQPMDSGYGMQQPMDMGMQQPMDSGYGMQPSQPMMQQQPIQPPIAEPAYMPPQMPQSLQTQPVGYQEGGSVIVGAGSRFPQVISPGEDADSSSINVLEGVDIGQAAGTVDVPRIEVDDDLVATAEDLQMRLEDEPPYAVANKILAKAEEKGAELTGDTQTDLAGIYASLTGDPAAYEKNIDDLNRGIIGAAIGAGTSARATENISKGLLVGLEAAKETEERRVKDSRALQLAELQARAEEAREANKASKESRAYRNPVDAYQDAYQAVMNASEIDLEIPEGMSREDYADQVAVDLIRRSYSPEQLVGSPFEGMSAPAADSAGPANVDQEAVLEEARNAIKGGRDPAGVAAKLKQMGIDPELL
jgi:hypothetical protein